MAVPTTDAVRHLRLHTLGIESGVDGEDSVISLEGDLDLATVAAVDEELRRVEAAGCNAIVFDLRRLEFLDSTGIHLLMQAYTRSARHGREVSLLVGEGPVHRVLDVCGALEILPTKAAA